MAFTPRGLAEFIRCIELDCESPDNAQIIHRWRLSPPSANRVEGYIVAGGLIGFTGNVSALSKKDIIEATLLAQLAADKKHNRETNAREWYGFYNSTLANLGFVIQGFEFQQYSIPSGSTVKIDDIVIHTLVPIASPGEMVVISKTLEALHVLPSTDGKILLFNSHSNKSNSGNFQVCSCDQAANGDVTLAMGAFYFEAKEKHWDFLFRPWGSKTKIYKGVQRVVLNSDVYANVRSAVIEKLEEVEANLVVPITI